MLHLSGLDTTAHTVTTALDTLSAYVWRVKACTEDGTFCGAWSSVWRFTTRPLPLRRYYYLSDHLGSVRATVNEAGAVVQYGDYYPFGAALPGRDGGNGEDGDPAGKPRYTGHEREWEIDDGVYYAGARYYDALIGKWNTTDPLDQYASPYVYVGNNPIGFLDPTGLAGCEGNEGESALDCTGGFSEGETIDLPAESLFECDDPPCKNIFVAFSGLNFALGTQHLLGGYPPGIEELVEAIKKLSSGTGV